MIKSEVLLFLIFTFFVTGLNAQRDSITYYEKEISNLKQMDGFTKKDTNYIKLLNALGSKFKHISADTLELLSSEALAMSREMDYRKGKVDALSNLAIFELINANFEKSLQYNQEVLTNVDASRFPRLAANVYNIMGQTYFALSNYPEAYKHMNQALLTAEMTTDADLKVKINSNLGTLFSLLEDYDEALKYYEVALSDFEEDSLSVFKSGIESNLGYLYMKKKDSSKALELLRKSLPVLEQARVTEIIPIVYTTFGEVYYSQEVFDRALAYFEKAITYYESLHDPRNKASVLYGLGVSHLALNNLIESEEFLNKSNQIYKQIDYQTGLLKSYKALYELNKKKKSIKKALEFLELSEKYSDSVYQENSARSISMLKAKMDFERQKEQLVEENKTSLAKQRNLLYIFSVLLLLSLAILFFYRKHGKIQERLNAELNSSQKALKINENRLKEANAIKDQLFSIIGHDLRGPILSINQLMDLCLKEDENGEVLFNQFAPKLKSSAEYFQFTLENLLNWGKSQLKGSIVESQNIVVRYEMDNLCSFFELFTKEKLISITNEIEPDKIVNVDLDHFRVIFRNLLSNAIKFTPKNGKIEISAKQTKEHSIHISIKDSGEGMDDETIKKVLSDEEHYSTYGTAGEKGTGLGLLLCKDLIARNKGSIHITSELGKGSNFIVELPSKKILEA